MIQASLAALATLLVQSEPPRDLASLLEPVRAMHGMPALAAAVIEGGELTALGAVGVRRIGSDEAVTVEDRWHLGSCTKSMTATLIACLIEKKRLRWDTTLGQVYPELLPSMHEHYRGVTVRELVDHRARLPENKSSGSIFAVPSTHPIQAQRLARFAKTLQREPISARDTGAHVYSNTGFIIAGSIVEQVTGKTWEEAIAEELFVPLGMNNAGFGSPGHFQPKHPSNPWGHFESKDSSKPVKPGHTLASHPAWYGPSGNIHASLSDWARFIALHLDEASPVLSRDSLQKMRTPVEGATYACGFSIVERPWASGPIIAHNGRSRLWSCFFCASPADGFAVLVACNQGGERADRAVHAAVEVLIASRKTR